MQEDEYYLSEIARLRGNIRECRNWIDAHIHCYFSMSETRLNYRRLRDYVQSIEQDKYYMRLNIQALRQNRRVLPLK
jgi:hypothetical protein